jgi:hypothetical protein
MLFASFPFVAFHSRLQVALDCLSYHASASDDDTETLIKAAVPTSKILNLYR